MYIPEEMQKVNKFQDVAIPSNKSFFARLGIVSVPQTSFTGDDIAPMESRKVDSLADSAELYEQYAAQEAAKSSE